MGLNDEIGNFSKRREVEEKPKKQYDDEDEYDDWEDDEHESGDYDDFAFKMYKLDELAKFNQELKELDELISPWWKNLKTLFTKTTMGKIGLITYKKKSLLADDTFENVQIRNTNESLEELKVFDGILQKSYRRHFMFNIYGLVFYAPFIYWTGWNMIWYFLVAWSLFDMGLRHFKYAKQKEWFFKAEIFIKAQDTNESSLEIAETRENKLAEIMDFNEAISKEDNEHWSIKVYDAIENLFKRKK